MERPVQVPDAEPPHGLSREEGRIDPLQTGHRLDDARPGLSLEGLHTTQDLREHLLCLPDHDKVEEGLEGRRVEHERSSPDHEGSLFPFGGPDRNGAEGKHVEDVGCVELIGEGEADHVHLSQGRARFEGEEGRLCPLR